MIHAGSELTSKITVITAELTQLPSVIRYYDDFDEKYHSIREPESSDLLGLRA